MHAMADVAQRYASLTDLRARLTTRDTQAAQITASLDAASTAVERYCGRVFTLDSTATARVFTALSSDMLTVDDIGTPSGLAVATGGDGTYGSVVTSQVWLGPDNALAHGEPLTKVCAAGAVFPVMGRPTVQVTAKWGWPDVPADISEAVLILASRLWSRKDSPQGVMGFGDLGVVRVSRADYDVMSLIDAYRVVPL